MDNNLIDHVNYALSSSNQVLPDEILNIPGYSGKAFKNFINTLLSQKGIYNYLEIGVAFGSTSIPALYNNIDKLNYYWLCDNWCLFENASAKEIFFRNFRRFLSREPNIIEMDCFQIDLKKEGIEKIDVYFYDGEHYEEDQFKALSYFLPGMNEFFIYIVDDWNWDSVKKGTLKAIKDNNLRILCQKEMGTNNTEDKEGWWNGCGIFVLAKGTIT